MDFFYTFDNNIIVHRHQGFSKTPSALRSTMRYFLHESGFWSLKIKTSSMSSIVANCQNQSISKLSQNFCQCLDFARNGQDVY